MTATVAEERDANVAHLRAQTRKLELEGEHLAFAYETRRDFLFSSTIDDRSVDTCIEVCTHWARTKEPITVTLMSPGGGTFSGFGLIDFLADLSAELYVTTSVYGYAASMAVAVLQAGTIRTMSPNSYLMLHEASTLMRGATSSLRDQVDFMEKMQARYVAVCASRSNVDAAYIADKTNRRDWWLDADEALELGFVDEIRKA